MSARATFGDWLRETREAHGYSQGELGEAVGMKRTYVNALENETKWPRPETRARFHAVFGTSDGDLVEYGAATRREYRRPDGGVRVVYEPTVRRGDAPVTEEIAGVPAEVVAMLARIDWSGTAPKMVAQMLTAFVDDEISRPACADTPAEPRPATAPPARTSRQH